MMRNDGSANNDEDECKIETGMDPSNKYELQLTEDTEDLVGFISRSIKLTFIAMFIE